MTKRHIYLFIICKKKKVLQYTRMIIFKIKEIYLQRSRLQIYVNLPPDLRNKETTETTDGHSVTRLQLAFSLFALIRSTGVFR